MPPSFHFDVGSQYATCSVLCLVFGLTFLALGRRFPHIRGVATVGGSFLLFAAGLVLFLARGPVPFALSVVGSNMVLWIGLLLLYQGFADLLKLRSRLVAPALAALVGSALLAWFSRGEQPILHPPRIVERIVTLSVVGGAIAACFLVQLVRARRAATRWNALSSRLPPAACS